MIIKADSLVNLLIKEINSDYVIEADSLLIQIYYIVKLVLFIDQLNQKINHCLSL